MYKNNGINFNNNFSLSRMEDNNMRLYNGNNNINIYGNSQNNNNNYRNNFAQNNNLFLANYPMRYINTQTSNYNNYPIRNSYTPMPFFNPNDQNFMNYPMENVNFSMGNYMNTNNENIYNSPLFSINNSCNDEFEFPKSNKKKQLTFKEKKIFWKI